MTTFTAADCRLEDFRAVVEQTTGRSDYPLAEAVADNVLIYGPVSPSPALRDELTRALADGPGIVVFRQAFAPAVVDRATAVFASLIAEQKAAGVAGGDHFAKPGANDRVWGRWTNLPYAIPARSRTTTPTRCSP
jgi:hypothetical protein